MKNLKYIYALSSVFVTLFAFDYKTNYQDIDSSTSTSDDTSNSSSISTDTLDTGIIIDDLIKSQIVSSYNSHYSSNNKLKLTKGNLIKYKDNTPITLSFKGDYLLSNNSLSSYVIDTDYSYKSSKESFEVSYGSTSYDSINYNNKLYLFSSSNELGGILSFPSTLDNKYPFINDNSSFSSIFNTFLSLDSKEYNVYKSDLGYLFKNDELEINTDSNYNLTKVNGIKDDIKYEFNFKTQDLTSSLSSLNSESNDFITTLKTILQDSSFDINFNADIKSKTSSNLKFVGNVKLDYSNAVTKDDPLISLDLTHYTNGNLSNEVYAQYDDSNLYFKVNDLIKGLIDNTTASEMINIASGLMSDSSFNYDFNNPLNELMNTDIFNNIMNLNISSLDSSFISNLEIKHNLISFGIDSSAFNLNTGIIRFEIGLNNAKIKSIKIKDFNIDNDKSINLEMYLNTPKGLNHLNKNEYPSYNSILPIYKNVMSIMKEGKVGGDFSTTLFDSSSSQTLGVSTHYDVNFKNALSNMSLDNLILSLSDLKINFLDETDSNSNPSTINALFLMDTSNSSKSTFNIEISNLNYQKGTFYIELNNSSSDTSSKYTTSTSSIKEIIESVKTLTGGSSSSNNTDKGFKAITKEIERLDYLVYFISHNDYVQNAINNIKNNYSLKDLEDFFTITNLGDGIFNLEFDMYNLVGQNSFVFRDYNLSRNCSLLIGGNGNLLGLNVNGLNVDGMSVSTHLGKTYYDSSNVLDDNKIKEEWTNTDSNPNKVLDLNNTIKKITGLIDTFNGDSLKNATLSNLIDISFAYNKEKSLSGQIFSKIHFDKNSNIDEKYVEGNIPLTLSDTTEVNGIKQLNAQFIYSDKNYDESSFKNDFNESNKSRLKAGTQIGLSFEYGSQDNNRSNSKLYAYSDTKTVMNILESLDCKTTKSLDTKTTEEEKTSSYKVTTGNTLWPYKIVRTICQYASNIKGILQPKNTSTIDMLKKLGINDFNSIMDLVNNLNTNKTLSTIINIGELANDSDLNKFNVLVEIKFDDSKNFGIESISAYSVNENKKIDNNLTVNLNIKEQDPDVDIISGFETFESGKANYIDATNVYNLLQLGIYTTEKKYYNISGTLNFGSAAEVKDVPILGDLELNGIEPLNDLIFDIKLNLFKDEKPENFEKLSQEEQDTYINSVYKIRGYLKVQQKKNKNKITEFFIEPGETDATGTIYVCQSEKGEATKNITYTNTSNDNFDSYFKEKYSSQFSSYTYTNEENIARNGINVSKNDRVTSTNYNTIGEAEKGINELLIQYDELYGKLTTNSTQIQERTTHASKGEILTGEKENEDEVKNELKQKSWYNDSFDSKIAIKKRKDGPFWNRKYYYWAEATDDIYTLKNKTVYYIAATENINIKTIYNYNYKLTYNTENSIVNAEFYHMSKEQFLGNCTYNGDPNNTIPRMLYYLLDYSGILNEGLVDVTAKAPVWVPFEYKYITVSAKVSLKELILSNIFSSMNGSNANPSIDYLNGWSFNVANKNGLNDYIEINPSKLMDEVKAGDTIVSFGTGIRLSFIQKTKNDDKKQDNDDETQNNTETWSFTISQYNPSVDDHTSIDEDKYFINASMESGPITMTLNLKILTSTFNFTASNNKKTIEQGMARWNSFIEAYKNSDYYKTEGYYIKNIHAGATKFTYDLHDHVFVIYCDYGVDFNNSNNRFYGSKVGDSTFFEHIKF